MNCALSQTRKVTLVEVLDRAINKGVVLNGDITVSLADVDLIFIGLRLIVASVETAQKTMGYAGQTGHIPACPVRKDEDICAPTQPAQNSGTAQNSGPAPTSVLIPPIGGGGASPPEDAERGLVRLVLTLVEAVRKLMEKQALRRIEGGHLSEAEIERLGNALMGLENKMEDLKRVFGLKDEDLGLNLGPLGDLT